MVDWKYRTPFRKTALAERPHFTLRMQCGEMNQTGILREWICPLDCVKNKEVALLSLINAVWGFTPRYAVLNFSQLAAAAHIPVLDWPAAPELVQAYYYRWRLFKKHLVNVSGGYAIDEFNPSVHGARPIFCSAGHHVAEGFWLRDPAVIDGVLGYWTIGPFNCVRVYKLVRYLCCQMAKTPWPECRSDVVATR